MSGFLHKECFSSRVQVGVVSREGVSSDGGALMSPGTLLAHLMTDDDDGAHSPNPATYYLLKRKLRCDRLSFFYRILAFELHTYLTAFNLSSKIVVNFVKKKK